MHIVIHWEKEPTLLAPFQDYDSCRESLLYNIAQTSAWRTAKVITIETTFYAQRDDRYDAVITALRNLRKHIHVQSASLQTKPHHSLHNVSDWKLTLRGVSERVFNAWWWAVLAVRRSWQVGNTMQQVLARRDDSETLAYAICWEQVLLGKLVPLADMLYNAGVLDFYLTERQKNELFDHDFDFHCECRQCSITRASMICSECREYKENCTCNVGG